MHRIFPYGADDWSLAIPAVLLTLVTLAAAAYLSTRRDLGAGLLASRLGPATASPGLRTPLALAWRLHRGLLIGWIAGQPICDPGWDRSESRTQIA